MLSAGLQDEPVLVRLVCRELALDGFARFEQHRLAGWRKELTGQDYGKKHVNASHGPRTGAFQIITWGRHRRQGRRQKTDRLSTFSVTFSQLTPVPM